MANIEIRIDDRRLNEVLAQLEGRVEDFTPAMKQVGEYLRLRTEENFRAEQTPEGRAWERLSPGTLARKATRNSINKILQDTGDLRGSIAYQAEAKSVKIGTNIAVGNYSLGAIHQFGAPRRNIPARPFLGANNDDIEEVTQIILDYLAEQG